ncbi:hypothetical protein OHB41_43400 [Streptomyces sp. NBC_01571]|uniref:hypothetical protein n=1 Tax=Streptomyces sp. NBC_01571 TaxID=2975883 RepID=UPI002254FA85|nr:hypothetical protein [Streptomyces sp. NBC_01571]MCX4579899.1 hypothetical protein [Streptomyces sp. NBC_01571]
MTVYPYLPRVEYIRPWLTRDPAHISTLMDAEPGGDGTGRDFPDPWARLHAQEGHESAARIGKTACSVYDALHHGLAEAEYSQPTAASSLLG